MNQFFIKDLQKYDNRKGFLKNFRDEVKATFQEIKLRYKKQKENFLPTRF